MRSLYSVLDKLFDVAPDLRSVLKSIQESSAYAAPEAQSMWWREAADTLNRYALDHPQRKAIERIFSGTES